MASKRPTRRGGALRLYLVRHGQALDHEVPGFVQGPLTPLGHRQAERLARRLAALAFDHIYTSDLSRALDTARPAAARHRKTPFTITRDLRETGGMHTRRGRTETRLREATRSQFARVERFAKRLLRAHRPGETVLVVAHGNLINLLLALLGGWEPKCGIPFLTRNTCVTIATVRDEAYPRWGRPLSIELFGCVAHLPERMITVQ